MMIWNGETKLKEEKSPILVDSGAIVVGVPDIGRAGREYANRTRLMTHAGGDWYLSRRELCVAESWLRSGNYTECVRACIQAGFPKPKSTTVKKWLLREHVQRYLTSRAEDLGYTAGYTRERYFRELQEIKEGRKKATPVTMMAMKLIGSYLGISDSAQVELNQVIEFKQSNGA